MFIILKWFAEILMTVLLVKDVYKINVKFLVLDILNVCLHKHVLTAYAH